MLAPSSPGTRAWPTVLAVRPGSRFAGAPSGCLRSRSDPVVAPGHDCAVRAPRPHSHTHVHYSGALRRSRRGLARRKFAAPPPTRGRRCDGWLLSRARCLGAAVAGKASRGLRREGWPEPSAHTAAPKGPPGDRKRTPRPLRAAPRQPGRCPSGREEGSAAGTVGRLRTVGWLRTGGAACTVEPVRTTRVHDAQPGAASAPTPAGDTPLLEPAAANGEDRILQEVGHFRVA